MVGRSPQLGPGNFDSDITPIPSLLRGSGSLPYFLGGVVLLALVLGLLTCIFLLPLVIIGTSISNER